MKFSTQAIHQGQLPDPLTGAVIPPVYLTSTFKQKEPGKTSGYEYSRAGNPNFTNLEQTLASLEQGRYATVFSSGLGATTALAALWQQEDLILATSDLYGGTFRLFKQIFSRFGLKLKLFDPTKPAIYNLACLKPKMMIIESPTNPLLKLADIKQLTSLARRHGILTVVDNTFATPYWQNPLTLGADIVLHSTTKYINGHSDVIGGVLITNNKNLKEQFDFLRMSLGLNPSPFDVWLIQRGVKTLALRLDRHQENAIRLARFLETHPLVKKIYYPGLKSHPQYKLALRQMKGFGGIISVEFKLSLKQIKKMISSLRIFTLAESLGGIESLIDHPASMTHASIPRSQRLCHGLSDGLLRISVGIEDTADLINDFKQALSHFDK